VRPIHISATYAQAIGVSRRGDVLRVCGVWAMMRVMKIGRLSVGASKNTGASKIAYVMKKMSDYENKIK